MKVTALLAALALTTAATAPILAAPESEALARWGVFARLDGTRWKSTEPYGMGIRFRWDKPNEQLLEEWGTESDPVMHTMFVTPGAEKGALQYRSQSIGRTWGKNIPGEVQPDGSVRFLKKVGFEKPFEIRLNADGVLERRLLAMTGDQVVGYTESKYSKYILDVPNSNAAAVALLSSPQSQPAAPQSLPSSPSSDPTGSFAPVAAASGITLIRVDGFRVISGALDDSDRTDFGGSFFDEYSLSDVPSGATHVLVRAKGFEPIAVIGKRAMDGAIDVIKFRTANLKHDENGVAIGLGVGDADVLRVSALGTQDHGTYELEARSGPLPALRPAQGGLDESMAREAAATHASLRGLQKQRAMKALRTIGDSTGPKTSTLLDQFGERCASVYRTDAGVAQVDWTSIVDVLYGVTTSGEPMVALEQAAGVAPNFTFLVADELSARAVAQKMNLLRALCGPLPR